jgi:hypothetical protein
MAVRKLIGAREACVMLGISRATLWYRTRMGDVPSVAVTLQGERQSYSYDPEELRRHLQTKGSKGRKAAAFA